MPHRPGCAVTTARPHVIARSEGATHVNHRPDNRPSLGRAGAPCGGPATAFRKIPYVRLFALTPEAVRILSPPNAHGTPHLRPSFPTSPGDRCALRPPTRPRTARRRRRRHRPHRPPPPPRRAIR